MKQSNSTKERSTRKLKTRTVTQPFINFLERWFIELKLSLPVQSNSLSFKANIKIK